MSIPFYYDPMIAKMICHADTREQAIEKTLRAIDEYEITGLETTLGFCAFVLKHPAFTSGQFDTKFVEKYFKPEVLKAQPAADEEILAVALAATATTASKPVVELVHNAATPGKWKKNRLN